MVSKQHKTGTVNWFASKRAELGITVREIALRVEITEKTVWQWEHDRTTPQKRLLAIAAEAYEVTLDELTAAIATQMLRMNATPARKRASVA